MKRDRGYYRRQRRKHINRKKKIIHKQNDYWCYKYEGELSKSKIHCSCALCTQKTRNKGKRRRVYGNYAKSVNWKHSDKQKIERMDEQLKEERVEYINNNVNNEDIDIDAINIEDVSLEGVPLNGHYLESMIDTIDF